MIIEEICKAKLEGVERRKKEYPLSKLKEMIIDNKNNEKFKNALLKKGLTIIGEAKKASPSQGIIREDFNIENIIKNYQSSNVSAISVLTEENYFKGSLENLIAARKFTSKPILRKDFIIDLYEIYESKIYSADAVLLIATILKGNLGEFCKKAIEIGVEPVVEVHDEVELELALMCHTNIIGINNRDLKTFNVDIKNTERLINQIPKDKIVISESGIKCNKDMEYIKSLGVDGVLIGEYFMRSMI